MSLPNNFLIADAHLDLSYNALRGRDVLRPAAEQTPDEEGIPTVGLPDLYAGRVGLIFATIFCVPALENPSGYKTPDEASAIGRKNLDWYLRHRDAGLFRFVQTKADLPDSSPPVGWAPPTTNPLAGQRPSSISPRIALSSGTPGEGRGGGSSATPPSNPPLPMLLLLEGADPIRDPSEIPWWFSRGLRAVGLAWKQTRYAGGTRAPGPLTPEGIILAKALDSAGIIHDTSHLAEQSFWQLLDLTTGPVMASHSNCRSIVPTDRQLSDDMIRAISSRSGVIGINFYDKFLLPPDQYAKRRATLADVVRHIKHICDLTGAATHVGIGTDMDGGLGRNEIPHEITTSADLPRIADALSSAGFTDKDVIAIMGANWRDFLARSLP